METVSSDSGVAIMGQPLLSSNTSTTSAADAELEALKHELIKVSRYQSGRCGTAPLLAPHGGWTYASAAQHLIDQPSPSLRAIGLWSLSRCISADDTVVVDGRALDQSALNFKAIEHDPLCAHAYSGLATLLPKTGKFMLPDGRVLGKIDLYLEALKHERRPHFYCNLASVLEQGKVTLPDGRALDRLQLLFEALQCDPEYVDAYFFLTVLMQHPTVRLLDGRHMTRRELLLEALRVDPGYFIAYHNLAYTLGPGESITLVDGRSLTNVQLYLEALRNQHRATLKNVAQTYYNLACTLPAAAQGTHTLHDGRSLCRNALLLESLRCNPDCAKTIQQLTLFLPHQHRWTRHNHAILFRKQTNALFCTLLLGLQRLEDSGVLPLAHQAMLEDMLEDWVWGDAQNLLNNNSK